MPEESAAASWLWQPSNDLATMISFLHARGVHEVFVSVPWTGPDPTTVAAATALRTAGFVLSCLGGDPDWAETPAQAGHWATQAMSSRLFAGIHLDVEPWSLSRWRGREDHLLTGLAQAIESVRRSVGRQPIDVDLPAWLATDHPLGYTRLAHAADRVTILAYRDRARDVLALASSARGLSRAVGRDYRIAVETRPAGDPSTTFADDGVHVLRRELSALRAALAVDQLCRGVAVHDVAGWMALGIGRPATGSGHASPPRTPRTR